MSGIIGNKQMSAHGDDMKADKIWIWQIQLLVPRFI